MNRRSGFLIGFAAWLIFACNNKNKVTEPFDEILSHAPFGGLSDSIRQDPSNHDLYFRRAVLLNSNNFPEPALADFRKAWSLYKKEDYAYGLGNLLLEKKPDSAIIFLNQAIRDLPESFLLPLTLGR